MGIVFGVYRNWIWEFGDLKSDSPILRGSIWVPNTMESRTIIVFAVFDLTWRRVPLKVRNYHLA